MRDLIKSEAQFGIHLDGESAIDAFLLSRTIADMAELTQAVAQGENPDVYLKMNVTAFKNGSFQIDFSAICEIARDLGAILGPMSSFATTVVTNLKGALEIKKLLKGKAPKSIETSKEDDSKIIVKSNQGQIITVGAGSAIVINNRRADQLATNICQHILDHNPQGGFTFIGEDGATLAYTPEEVLGMSKLLPICEEKTTKLIRMEATLPIKKADILGHSSWDFRFRGKSITAKIDDEKFLDEIHSGVAVKAGDYITALLEIQIDLDEIGTPVEGSEQYRILSVRNGIQHNTNEQTKL